MSNSKKCIIRFSSDDITINNKPLKEVIENEVKKTIGQAFLLGKENFTEDMARAIVEGQIRSKRENEKMILQTILLAYMKDIKLLAEQNIVADMSSTINESDDSVIFDKLDVEKFLKEGFKKVEKQGWWINCKELFKQLERPEEVEEQ